MQRKISSRRPSPPARRISVVGPSGSGKSVLSRTLAERLSLPRVELDQLRQAGATDADPDAAFVRQVAARAAEPAWVIDGHYRLVRDIVWRRADMIVWLNYPLGFVLFRLARRYAARLLVSPTGRTIRNSREGSSRPPGASWSRRFSRLARNVRERREYRTLLAEAKRSATLIELRSDNETRTWLRSMEPRPTR